MADPKTIFLAPVCASCGEHEDGPYEGRCWAEDTPWDAVCGCGAKMPPAPRYVLAPAGETEEG